jgi:lactate permease
LDYALWSLPAVVVAVLIGAGRSSATAGFWGLVLAIAVALAAAPGRFGPLEAAQSAASGAWLALLVGAVILGGLFFRDIVAGHDPAGEPPPVPAALRRRQLYLTCFLIGPFAESATGFGVGQVAIAPALRSLGLTPLHAVLLGLFSQMLVPWGALANGTIVGAELSGLPAAVLGVHSAALTVPLLLGWLVLFWRMAAAAGVPGTRRDLYAELAWTLLAAALLILCNFALGPEVAALAALGPLIVARFVAGGPRTAHGWRAALRVALPYAALIAGLAATRAMPSFNRFLTEAVAVRPFADGATWLPLLHPASWLVMVALATALAAGRAATIAGALERAWLRAAKPILAIVLFLAMAQVMVSSGMAGGLAKGLTSSLGPAAVLATPLIAAFFGFLTSSGSAANGLLMPAQAAFARESGLSLPWLAAIQNVGAAAATMLCPVRVGMGCALAGRPEVERLVYARAWPLGIPPLAVLVVAAAALLLC